MKLTDKALSDLIDQLKADSDVVVAEFAAQENFHEQLHQEAFWLLQSVEYLEGLLNYRRSQISVTE